MYLTQKHFDFCDKVGVMVMNQTPEKAHQTLVQALSEEPSADPDFIERVKATKVSQSNISYAVIYRYSVDVEYVVNGIIKNGHIADYGNNGTPSALDVTNFYKDGNYKTYESIDPLKLELYNDHNLFNLQELKEALKKVIDKQLPSNYTYFKSTNWNAIAYLVPIYSICVKDSRGKEWQLHYNLHNLKYRWEWPWNPALDKKAKVAGLIQFGLDAGGIVLPAIGTIAGLANLSKLPDANAFGALAVGIVGIVAASIAIKKTKKNKKERQDYFHKNPKAPVFKCVIKHIVPPILGAIFMIIAFVILGAVK